MNEYNEYGCFDTLKQIVSKNRKNIVYFKNNIDFNKLNYRGIWNNTSIYKFHDVVVKYEYNDGEIIGTTAYVMINENESVTGVSLENDEYWVVYFYAPKGEKGEKGDKGNDGIVNIDTIFDSFNQSTSELSMDYTEDGNKIVIRIDKTGAINGDVLTYNSQTEKFEPKQIETSSDDYVCINRLPMYIPGEYTYGAIIPKGYRLYAYCIDGEYNKVANYPNETDSYIGQSGDEIQVTDLNDVSRVVGLYQGHEINSGNISYSLIFRKP